VSAPTITVGHRPDVVTLDVAGVTVHIDAAGAEILAAQLMHHAAIVRGMPAPRVYHVPSVFRSRLVAP
jgi:hypothetical protein